MSGPDETDNAPRLISNGVMDVLVALALLLVAGVFIFDSVRVGHGWVEGQGPGPGFFPFMVSVLLAFASAINFWRALRSLESGPTGTFVTTTAFGRVLAVAVPTLVYVGLIPFIGIYVASAIFIAGFTMAFGSEPIWRAILVGVLVPVALFLMFEIWFQVPLPKGPLEAWLGY